MLSISIKTNLFLNLGFRFLAFAKATAERGGNDNKTMTIYLGADHGGFNLKEHLKDILKKDGYDVGIAVATSHVRGAITRITPFTVAKQVERSPDLGRGILVLPFRDLGWISPRTNLRRFGPVLPMSPGPRFSGPAR